MGGRYYRVAEREWTDPLDPTFAAVGGGRWNPVGLPCLYLNDDLDTARANVRRNLAGMPYGPEDLDPEEGPVLVDAEVRQGTALDAYSGHGIVELGLPLTYPVDEEGRTVPHERCQPLGRAALESGLDGVDARSAAPGGNRELAWLAATPARLIRVRIFADWW